MPDKRRRNGEGSIYQRADGYWSASISIGKDDKGKLIRRTITGRSYDDVAAQFDIERGRIQQGGGLIPTKTSIGDWLDAWLVSASPKLRRTTRDGYAIAIKRIKRYIGGSKLSTISIKQVNVLFSALKQEGLSIATIKKTMSVLGSALNRAVSAHMILVNPLALFDMPKVEHKPPTIMTVNGQRTFSNFCEKKADKGSVFADIFLFILETGLRIGEVAALEWGHIINRDERVFIHVQQTAARITNDNEDDDLKTRIHIGKPKTAAGERIIPATQNAIRIMNRCKARQKIKTDYVFAAKNGSIVQERNIRRALESYCKQLGMKRLTVHELRHTFSTRMYEVGIPSEERARIMGHADSRTTDRVYVTLDVDSLSTAMSNYENGIKKLDGCYKTATTMTASLQPE